MTEELLAVYRHSLAHILAKAVIEIFGKENVQYAIGPQIADGLYYDFVLPRNITEDDYKVIEDKMNEIIKRKEDWIFRKMSGSRSITRAKISWISAADRMFRIPGSSSRLRSR